MSKSNEPVWVAVTSDLRDRFGWLKDAVSGMMENAVQRERTARMKPRVRSAKGIALEFTKRMKDIRNKQGKCDEDKKVLLRLWAQRGLTNIEGVTVKPSVGLVLNERGLIEDLDQRVKGLVVEMRPHLNLPELFRLAKGDEKLQSTILGHLAASATLSVTAPKD